MEVTGSAFLAHQSAAAVVSLQCRPAGLPAAPSLGAPGLLQARRQERGGAGHTSHEKVPAPGLQCASGDSSRPNSDDFHRIPSRTAGSLFLALVTTPRPASHDSPGATRAAVCGSVCRICGDPCPPKTQGARGEAGAVLLHFCPQTLRLQALSGVDGWQPCASRS